MAFIFFYFEGKFTKSIIHLLCPFPSPPAIIIYFSTSYNLTPLLMAPLKLHG